MKFKIKWRDRSRSLRIVEGISRYASRAMAEWQASIWRCFFPNNTYYIEPVEIGGN